MDLSWVDAEDLLISTGVRNISQSGSELTFSCPSDAHVHGDSRPSARMNVNTTAFICHGCGWRGNAINFLTGFKSLPETEARRLLEERYGGPEIVVAPSALAQEVKRWLAPEEVVDERVVPHESWVDHLLLDWPLGAGAQDFDGDPVGYMLGRGFLPEVLRSWQVGYDELSDRVTIPVRDVGGVLVGFKGRDWKGTSPNKYLTIGDGRGPRRYGFDTYHKSRHVFGLDRVLARHPARDAELVLVEGELNTIALDQCGIPDAAGVAGSEFSDVQADLVRSVASSVVVYFDGDDAGRRGVELVAERLGSDLALRVVVDPPGDAADLMDPAVLRALVDGSISMTSYRIARRLASSGSVNVDAA